MTRPGCGRTLRQRHALDPRSQTGWRPDAALRNRNPRPAQDGVGQRGADGVRDLLSPVARRGLRADQGECRSTLARRQRRAGHTRSNWRGGNKGMAQTSGVTLAVRYELGRRLKPSSCLSWWRLRRPRWRRGWFRQGLVRVGGRAAFFAGAFLSSAITILIAF